MWNIYNPYCCILNHNQNPKFISCVIVINAIIVVINTVSHWRDSQHYPNYNFLPLLHIIVSLHLKWFHSKFPIVGSNHCKQNRLLFICMLAYYWMSSNVYYLCSKTIFIIATCLLLLLLLSKTIILVFFILQWVNSLIT